MIAADFYTNLTRRTNSFLYPTLPELNEAGKKVLEVLRQERLVSPLRQWRTHFGLYEGTMRLAYAMTSNLSRYLGHGLFTAGNTHKQTLFMSFPRSREEVEKFLQLLDHQSQGWGDEFRVEYYLSNKNWREYGYSSFYWKQIDGGVLHASHTTCTGRTSVQATVNPEIGEMSVEFMRTHESCQYGMRLVVDTSEKATFRVERIGILDVLPEEDAEYCTPFALLQETLNLLMETGFSPVSTHEFSEEFLANATTDMPVMAWVAQAWPNAEIQEKKSARCRILRGGKVERVSQQQVDPEDWEEANSASLDKEDLKMVARLLPDFV